MKKIFLLGVITALTFATGCSKDDVADSNNNGNNTQTNLKEVTEFGAVLPEATRTTLNGNSVIWSAGDAISVWSDTEPTHKTFNIYSGVGETSAQFRLNPYGGKGVLGNTYFAVYPANNSSEATITLPSSQRYSADKNFRTNLNPMAAKVASTGTDPNPDPKDLQFHNLCGIIVVQLYTDDQSRNERITQIELQSQTGNLCGTGTIDFSGEIPTASFDNGSRNLVFDCSAEPQLLSKDVNNPNEFYIIVPAGSYNFLRLTFYIASEENSVRSVVRRTSLNVDAGKITYIGANVNVLPTPPAPPKTYGIGDLYPDGTNPQGVVFTIDADSTTGKMIALKDCGSSSTTYAWGPTATADVLGLTNASDGSVNMAMVLNNNALASYPAFKACRDLGTQWYLPAQNEMNSINGQYNDIQKVLGATSGAERINDDADYWTSTVTGGGRGGYSIYYLGVDGIMNVKTADQGEKNVRAIAKFDSKEE